MCVKVPDGIKSCCHIKHAENETLGLQLDLVMAVMFCIISHQSTELEWNKILAPITAHG